MRTIPLHIGLCPNTQSVSSVLEHNTKAYFAVHIPLGCIFAAFFFSPFPGQVTVVSVRTTDSDSAVTGDANRIV